MYTALYVNMRLEEARWYRKNTPSLKMQSFIEFNSVKSSELKSGINGPSANRRHSLFHQQEWKHNGEFCIIW